ncbi:MAG: type II toxin-antitoxin system prevent-host-death family antitoxin [Acetobacteraceae bacterium]
MATYSVADAKNHLPRLIDEALDGEDVVITRHGKPVVELRATAAPEVRRDRTALNEWMRARREARKGMDITSVELLRQLYEDE